MSKKIKQEPTAVQLAAEDLVRRAHEQGLSLTWPDGLLKQLTKTVLETALHEEPCGLFSSELVFSVPVGDAPGVPAGSMIRGI